MVPRLAVVASLLLVSGACALAYQVVWTRELRLVFGHSTAASAAVLAIFIGGLGTGSWLIGPRADRHKHPLALYARLEALIAIAAALSPFLLAAARAAYIGLGGTLALGPVLGTALRLLLAGLVLALPTFLMGGTLPAAAREVEGEGDARRRATALLYGVNTLGAVLGCLLTTFFALERFGSRRTLFAACAINLLAAAVAGRLARRRPGDGPAERAAAEPAAASEPAPAPRTFVLSAAALVGFSFFLLELVWYRMLGPLLGGTVFTFGLILALALLGIALGGAAYALLGAGRPVGLRALATTTLLEACAVAWPLLLGDRVAVLALLLRPMGYAGFSGHVFAWALVAGLVVLPAAFVAGVQFPMLIALLGRGRAGLGRDIGLVTVTNTAGAIVGALVGGFGLLPLLTAPGCWRLVAFLLVALGLAAAGIEAARSLPRAVLPVALAAAAAFMTTREGPTAAWRHSGIGAGRAAAGDDWSPNRVEDWVREQRRTVIWEAEGVESSIAIQGATGLAFTVNGKVDGHSRYDAPTQVMSGLLGALLHPAPRRILVVGLGTGSTAGWLADVPGVERVDVVELEPAVVEMARRSASVNRNALDNPRLHLRFADAREALLTSRERYDLVVSEPSNPYRAGIASLFSREFYQAVTSRLAEGGLFLQWFQAYEVDAASVKSLLATYGRELPAIEVWQTHTNDLMLVGARAPMRHDLERLRERIAEEPFRSALAHVWRTDRLEGVIARFVAGPPLARRIAAEGGVALNTDDRNTLEFGFARTLGNDALFGLDALRTAAAEAGADRPEVAAGAYDPRLVEDERLSVYSSVGEAPPHPTVEVEGLERRTDAHILWVRRQRRAALEAWRGQDQEPTGPNELALVAEITADAGEDRALPYIEALRAYQPAEADAVLGRLRLRQGRHEEALGALGAAIRRCATDPWPAPHLVQGAYDALLELGSQREDLRPRVLEVLGQELALRMSHEVRIEEAFVLSAGREHEPSCVALVGQMEPHVPFSKEWLEFRVRCYAFADSPLVLPATRDLRRFEARAARPLLEPR
jgi:spermidine synthase